MNFFSDCSNWWIFYDLLKVAEIWFMNLSNFDVSKLTEKYAITSSQTRRDRFTRNFAKH